MVSSFNYLDPFSLKSIEIFFRRPVFKTPQWQANDITNLTTTMAFQLDW